MTITGDDMLTTYWSHTDEHPGALPINEREAWHRDACDREQTELFNFTLGEAGRDAPARNFGYANAGTVHER